MIRLVFSETPMIAVSRMMLMSSSTDTIPLGEVHRDPSDPHAISAGIPKPLGPGTYWIHWATVASDGHPARGTIEFSIATASTPGKDSAAAAAPASKRWDNESRVERRRARRLAEAVQFALGAPMWLARWLAFVALFLVVGAVSFKYLILQRIPPSAAEPGLFDHIATTAAATTGMFSAVALVVATLIKLYGETVVMHEIPVRTILFETTWGWAWLAQMIAALVVTGAFALAHRPNWISWPVAAICALVLVATPALTGHAIGSDHAVFAVPLDITHVLAGSAWLGTLAMVLLVGIAAAIKAPDTNSVGSRIATLVNAFSPIALVCGALIVATGVGTALLHLEPLSRLWTSTYGMTLIVKLALVSLLFSLGAWNWRRVRPNLGGEEGVIALRFSAKLELAASVLVLAVTAFLVALPLPD